MRSVHKLILVLALALIAVTGATARDAGSRDLIRERNNSQQQGERWRVRHGGHYYNVDQNQAELLRQAIRQGYQQGYQYGRDARRDHRRGGYRNDTIYRQGTYGYNSGVDRYQYQYYFQQGYQRGYQDGYNSHFHYGHNVSGTVAILDTILRAVLNLQRY